MVNKRILYFDLETQKSADDVGGWSNVHLMKLAVGCIYDSLEEKYFTYLENDVDKLFEHLYSSDMVVGFNVENFDYTVIKPYQKDNKLDSLNTFDMLNDINSILGHRLALGSLAEINFNAKKSADGLLSVEWFKEGKMDKIISYCEQDVKVTKDLFLYGVENKKLKYKDRKGNIKQFNVDWSLNV